jgi:hypothetical protein
MNSNAAFTTPVDRTSIYELSIAESRASSVPHNNSNLFTTLANLFSTELIQEGEVRTAAQHQEEEAHS